MADEKFYERVAFKKKKTINKSAKKENTKQIQKPSIKTQNDSQIKPKNKAQVYSQAKLQNTNEKNTKINKKITTDAKILYRSSLFSDSAIPQDALKILNDFDLIIQGVRPLNSRQIQQLPENIRNLSHQLTDDRSTRRLGYMNENTQLSAYVRYFTWWNLVRLTKLFANLSASFFPEDNSICLDLGSGPLTVVTALWLARPELRKKNLTWYCLDLSQNSLSLGEDIFLSVAAKIPGNTWKIIRVKGCFGTFIKQKADFLTCANMLNEIDQNSDMPPEYQVKKYYEQITAYTKPTSKFIFVEPGVPKAARTLSLLRARFNKQDYMVCAPCPHLEECPMSGFKAYTGSSEKWCNFAFNTENAPKKLQKLSTEAKLPKERAVLSFICAIPKTQMQNSSDDFQLRIVSDGFKLPNYYTGYYACSSLGLTLVATKANDSENNNSNLVSGDFLSLKLNKPIDLLSRDEKTNAVKIVL